MRKEMIGGPAMDLLVARKMMGDVVRPYSTNAHYVGKVAEEIFSRGYEVGFIETDVATICTLFRDSKVCVSVTGLTYEEAVCRAALKLVD